MSYSSAELADRRNTGRCKQKPSLLWSGCVARSTQTPQEKKQPSEGRGEGGLERERGRKVGKGKKKRKRKGSRKKKKKKTYHSKGLNIQPWLAIGQRLVFILKRLFLFI